MTEDEARELVRAEVGNEAYRGLERLVELVIAENQRQNLIGPSTIGAIWNRHILDSIQLITLAGPEPGLWLDIGTGGGFPGLAVAFASRRPMILAEPRRRRAEFLADVVDELRLGHVQVRQHKVEQINDIHAAVISARAVSSIVALFSAGSRCSTPQTQWLLLRGANYDNDVQQAMAAWSATFHVEHSLTDPRSRIVVATGVAAR